jgi:hypothetical protein
MTYWNALGFNDAPASPGVEEAAKWVQWAQYGVMDRSKEEEVRYNLTHFWNFKRGMYYTEPSAARQQYDKLDALANGILYALETRRAVAGKDDAANMAETARMNAAAAANRAGGSYAATMGTLFSKRTPTGADLKAIGDEGGIPWTAIGIGAGILMLALVLRD